MRAAIIKSVNEPIVIEKMPDPQPGPGEVVVQLRAAALNHRDLWIQKGAYHNKQYPCVLGSDGAGVVIATGTDVDKGLLNRAVLINPALHWGQRRQGHDKDFQILGMPTNGTFAEQVVVPAANVTDLPPGWNFEMGAALPLAGLTAYRALFYRGAAESGQTLLITGIGGGVATFLLTFAVAAGLRVYVSSSSEDKISMATNLGAAQGVLYTEESWTRQLLDAEPGGFDLIIDSAGGENFPKLLQLIKTGGKIVNFGGTAGKIPEIIPQRIFWKQASILGTTMGSPVDFAEMVKFAQAKEVRPVIDQVFAFEDVAEAFKHMESQQQFGKILLKFDRF
jgi:zinc-binding alcohol dehydrogenase/oxidoreductase